MKYFFLYIFCFISVIFSIRIEAQTYPVPYDMSKGDYCFTVWNPLSPAKTYPQGMIFQWVSKNQTAPFYNEGSADYDCAYNKISGPRINGLGYEGFGFETSSVSQSNTCDSTIGYNRFIGCAVLALNSVGRKNIKVYWEGGTVIKGDAENPRECTVRLQYRIGNDGDFFDFLGQVEYKSSIIQGDSVFFGPVTLPAECNNQRLIELRWIYFESAKNDGGSSPQIRVDEINISSGVFSNFSLKSPIVDASAVFINTEIMTIDLNNYYTNDRYEINLYTLLGESVFSRFSDQQFVRINTSRLPKGAYILTLRNTVTKIVVNQKLFIQ